jgi:hypothetical protein
MIRKILCIIAAISLLGASGCELVSKATEAITTTPASVRTIREAEIAKLWKVRQMEIDLATGVAIVLTLKDGDKVEGYYYLVKGDNINFSIAGISPIYASQPAGTGTKNITSDRFSFTANQGQGVAYTMTLTAAASANATGKNSETTVFLEIIYPVTGSLFVPIGTK